MNIKLQKAKPFIGGMIGLSIFIIALATLYHQTRNIEFSIISADIRSSSTLKLLLSLAATIVSFAAMAVNETIAVKTSSKKIKWKYPLLAGSVGNALSHTLGFHALTISVWRYRIYNRAGLSVLDITIITYIAFLGIILGFLGIIDLALFFSDKPTYKAISVILVLLIIGFFYWIGKKRVITIKNRHIVFPDIKSAVLQLIIGIIDMSAAIYAAYILLPPDIIPDFSGFIIIYIGSVLLGIVSQAPGGVGVFEAMMITTLAAKGRSDFVAALLLYRIIYNLMPFCLSCIVIITYEIRRKLIR